ncbi:hypothetical protein QQF64_034535 [Cirrhinus molitorella]|uniref:ribonuclease H n=1 Tax=Cirrhinus molitorella TaxID=172907 RepID=A0ABR3L277_9TELE
MLLQLDLLYMNHYEILTDELSLLRMMESEASSCLPLADFYATLPKHKENPVDYWIRLNKAADLALEGLRRQGKKTENINNEVALMFVKHCPDPELSCTLKCKPIHEWTSRDVQLRIDDYQRELRASGRAIGTAQLKNHVIAVTPEQPSVPPVNVAMPSQCHTPNLSLQAQHSVCPSNCPLPTCVPAQGEPIHSLSHLSAPAVAQNLQSQSDERLLTRMVDIFQDMMDKLQQRNTHHLSSGGRFRRTPRERRPNQAVFWGKLADLYLEGGSTGLDNYSHTDDTSDAESVYISARDSSHDSEIVVYQNIHRVSSSESLFYTPVLLGGTMKIGGMLDTGSMACSMSEEAEMKMKEAGVINDLHKVDVNVVLVGCGGLYVKPKCAFDVEMEVYGCKIVVPTLVVQGQRDELILGTNVIKHILHQSKLCESYWKTVSSPCPEKDHEMEQFLSMLSGLKPWKGDEAPQKVGTVRQYCDDRADIIPLSSQRPVLLRRNAKLADVYSCMAIEDMDITEFPEGPWASFSHSLMPQPLAGLKSTEEKLRSVGLSNIDIESCEVSEVYKGKITDLVLQYEDIFSRHHLDCGEAEGFVHRIHLSDERPFRLPYRRVPPGQYQKLRQVLSEMEDKEIIRKSTSEYASPLVLVWKKNGDLRICTDFRWLNKRTLKDAHPLPHQADCLAALGGNSLFSTMDLTSGFYNMPLHEEDRKYSAFTTPMGLYEYNRLPQGLCNSPGSFMRMMMSIFGDQNYLSLLCYLDDLLVFAPDEESALLRLKMVFERLRCHNLKLAPKKCFFLRRSVRFLGHVVDENGVSTDHSKVENITNMTSTDLMDPDGVTPSQKRIRSFLGMINYYQHFVPGYSAIAKPLFDLLKGGKRKRTGQKDGTTGRKLCAADWTPQQEQAFDRLKASLVNSMILAHPDFTRPFMLSTDASLEGMGAVLSQLQDGDTRARPIAFASKSLNQAQRNYPAHRLEFLALKWSICDKFSHWLKGHKFTVWTDNNPLTHILTKPKLDCCEQRWVAKLASYDFDIKYVPGRQNIVADALSRVPFVKESVGQRLLTEPYANLLSEVKDVSCDSVKNAFRSSSGQVKLVTVSNNVQSACDSPHVWAQSIGTEDVSAVLQSHMVWEAGPRARAVQTLQFLPQLIPPGINTLPAYTEKDLRDKQLDDRTLSRVLYYVERRWRPSRRARAKESVSVTRYLKHWDKLTMSNGVLYRVSKLL